MNYKIYDTLVCFEKYFLLYTFDKKEKQRKPDKFAHASRTRGLFVNLIYFLFYE